MNAFSVKGKLFQSGRSQVLSYNIQFILSSVDFLVKRLSEYNTYPQIEQSFLRSSCTHGKQNSWVQGSCLGSIIYVNFCRQNPQFRSSIISLEVSGSSIMSYQQSTLQKKLEIELDAIPVVVKTDLSGYLQHCASCLTSTSLQTRAISVRNSLSERCGADAEATFIHSRYNTENINFTKPKKY